MPQLKHKMRPESAKRNCKVFLVDDNRLVREHVAALLNQEADLEVCGEASDAPAALSLITQLTPDLVLLDIALKGSNGLDLLQELKATQPGLPVLILSMHDEVMYVERALCGGALGFITKEEATLHLLSAVRKVLSGQPYVSEAMSRRLLDARRRTRSPDIQPGTAL